MIKRSTHTQCNAFFYLSCFTFFSNLPSSYQRFESCSRGTDFSAFLDSIWQTSCIKRKCLYVQSNEPTINDLWRNMAEEALCCNHYILAWQTWRIYAIKILRAQTHIQLEKIILKVFWQEKTVFLTMDKMFVPDNFNFVLDKTSWTKVLSGQKDKAYMTKLHMHPMHWGFS